MCTRVDEEGALVRWRQLSLLPSGLVGAVRGGGTAADALVEARHEVQRDLVLAFIGRVHGQELTDLEHVQRRAPVLRISMTEEGKRPVSMERWK
jgi:hypothetical protein